MTPAEQQAYLESTARPSRSCRHRVLCVSHRRATSGGQLDSHGRGSETKQPKENGGLMAPAPRAPVADRLVTGSDREGAEGRKARRRRAASGAGGPDVAVTVAERGRLPGARRCSPEPCRPRARSPSSGPPPPDQLSSVPEEPPFSSPGLLASDSFLFPGRPVCSNARCCFCIHFCSDSSWDLNGPPCG